MGWGQQAADYLRDKANIDLARLKRVAIDNFGQWQETFDKDELIRKTAANQPATVLAPNEAGKQVGDLDQVEIDNNLDPRTLSRGEQWMARGARYPLRGAGVLGGLYIADQFIGKPVEGVIDAVTLGLTNFKENETRGTTFGNAGSVPYSIPYAQGTAYDANGNLVPNVSAPVPPMDEKTLENQIKRRRDNIAVDSVTLRELLAMQNQTRENTGYYG